MISPMKSSMEMARSQIMAIHKVVNPPMRVPAMYARRLNLLPGGENPVEHGREDGIRPLFQITPDIAAVEAKIRDTRQAVREGFFNDLFLMLLDKPSMTATEVAERHEEKLLMLGPVVERQESELLNPLLARVFALLDRSGRIPSRPEVLAGRDFRLEYVSVLSQAQRLIGTQPIRGLAAFAGQISALRPEVLDKLDLDAALDEYAAMIGAPPAMLRDKGEVARIRREREAGVMTEVCGPTPGEAEDGGSGSD